MKESIDLLYEDTRQCLLISERLDQNLSEINRSNIKLMITELIKTIQTDLLILLEFLGDLNNSPECDWDKIIEEFKGKEE
jgi:hypothetical protein